MTERGGIMSDAIEQYIDDNQDYSRARYSGYSSQRAYQRDSQLHFEGKICGALTQDKRYCRNKPMENGRCKFHGGMNPKGIKHHKHKHGAYSKYLPEALLAKYEEAESNEDLLSLRNEMALITTRLFELSEKVNETAGAQNVKELIHAYKRLKKARTHNMKTQYVLEYELEEIIEDVEKDLGIWEDIASMVNLKRKLVDSEQRKMNNLQQYVPAERVALLMGALMKIVVDEIEGLHGILMDNKQIEKSIRKIARTFRNMSNRGAEEYEEAMRNE